MLTNCFFQLGHENITASLESRTWKKYQFEMNVDTWEAIKEIVLGREKNHETQNWKELEHIF